MQQATATGNLAVLPQAQALASAVNKGNAAQLRAILNRGGQLDLAEGIVTSQLRGELSPDVLRGLQDTTAAEAMGLGAGGTGFQVGLAGLRGVLTRLQLQQQGLQNFGALSAMTTPKLMGPESMFFTPQQRLAFDINERDQRMKWDLLARHMAAQPNAADVALAEGFDNFFETWKNVGMGALGGMGGGMGGQPPTKPPPNGGPSGGYSFGGVYGEASAGANSFPSFNNTLQSQGAGVGTGEGGPL